MIKTYKANITVFEENVEDYRTADINIEQDRLNMFGNADEFVASVREEYPWITDKDAEDIRIAIALMF